MVRADVSLTLDKTLLGQADAAAQARGLTRSALVDP